MTPVISVNTMAYQGYALDVVLNEIAGLGATHVELSFTTGYVEGLAEDYFSAKTAKAVKRMITGVGPDTIALGGHINLGADDAVDAFKRRMDLTGCIAESSIVRMPPRRGKRWFPHAVNDPKGKEVVSKVECL